MDWQALADWHPHIFAQLTAEPPKGNATVPNAVAQIDMLKQQLEFLAKENARQSAEFTEKLKLMADGQQQLSQGFQGFVTTMQWVLGGLGLFGTSIIAALGYIFGKTIQETKAVAKAIATEKVTDEVQRIVNAEVEIVRRSLQRETVIGNTLVDYWLPAGPSAPNEFRLLRGRAFQNVKFYDDSVIPRRITGDVFVLDLENSISASGERFGKRPEAERETFAKEQIDAALDALPGSVAIVIYTRSAVKHIFSLPQDRYVSPATNPITLVGMVADAAYLAHGAQQRSSP